MQSHQHVDIEFILFLHCREIRGLQLAIPDFSVQRLSNRKRILQECLCHSEVSTISLQLAKTHENQRFSAFIADALHYRKRLLKTHQCTINVAGRNQESSPVV